MDEQNEHSINYGTKCITFIYKLLTPFTPIKGHTKHIAGIDNREADDISRVNELFTPQKTNIYDVPYVTLIQQVCHKYKKLKNWRNFQPSAQILSDLNFVLSSDYLMEVPKRRQNPE